MEGNGGGGSSCGEGRGGGGKKKLLKANMKAGDIGQTLELDHSSSGTVSIRVAK